MEVAIRNFHKIAGDRKVVILGDMYELGKYSKEEHQQIGRLLEECRFQITILVGEDMKYAVIYDGSTLTRRSIMGPRDEGMVTCSCELTTAGSSRVIIVRSGMRVNHF